MVILDMEDMEVMALGREIDDIFACSQYKVDFSTVSRTILNMSLASNCSSALTLSVKLPMRYCLDVVHKMSLGARRRSNPCSLSS
jgi:hypothetical protein